MVNWNPFLHKLTSAQGANGRRAGDPAERVPPVPAEAVHADDPALGEGVDDRGIADSLVGDDRDIVGHAELSAELRYLRQEDLK